MKKKLLSIISVAMAMTMTVSTFAATPRGAGDVDGDGKITANDVLMILKGLADTNPEANVDGRNGINGSDANVLYRTILQPKTVSEDLVFKAYSENYSLGKNPVSIVEGADKLGSTVVAGDKGMGIVDDAVSTTSDTTIKGAIDSLVNLVNESSAANISSQLDKIYFASATKGDVYLRSEEGWAMLCYAVQPIIPMDAETAAICNKAPSSDEDLNNPALKARYDALKEIKALIVSDKTLTADDIKVIKDAAYRAFSPDMTETEIKEAAQRILDIIGTRYTLTAEIKGNVETITPDGAFVNGLVSLAQYDTKTMADYRNTFGDKLVISVASDSGKTVSVVFEVAVVANAGSTPVEPTTEATTVTEATTEAPTEATTVTEATTEAPTETTTVTEATTEAPTETTTEAAYAYVATANVGKGGTIIDNNKATVVAGQPLGYTASTEAFEIGGGVFSNYVKTSGANTMIVVDGLDNGASKAYRIAFTVTAKEDMELTVYCKANKGKANYILSGNITLDSTSDNAGQATIVDGIDNTAGDKSVYDTMKATVKAGETVYVTGKGSDIVVYAVDVK